MLFKSALGEFSGKIGNWVASHNRGGRYFRTLTVPTNPQTIRQTEVREMMTGLSKSWTEDVPPGQRKQWERLAQAYPVKNRLGDTQVLSGIAMFIKCNVPLLMGGFPVQLIAPANLEVTNLVTVAITMTNEPTGTINVSFTPALGATECIVVEGCVNVSPGVTYVIPRLKYMTTTGTEETSPFTVATGEVGITGSAVWIRASILNTTNGAKSPGIMATALITAAP